MMTRLKCIGATGPIDDLSPVYVWIPDSYSKELCDVFIAYAKQLHIDGSKKSAEEYLHATILSDAIVDTCKQEISSILQDSEKMRVFSYCASHQADPRWMLD